MSIDIEKKKGKHLLDHRQEGKNRKRKKIDGNPGALQKESRG